MTHAKTIWDEGREPGYRVVALAVALALTVAVLDTTFTGRVDAWFDLVFVAVCVASAIRVRPGDLYVVCVLPPLLMLGVCLLFGLAHPATIAHRDDSLQQAVVSGLSEHGVALFVGYALCLACLGIRRKRATGALFR